METIEPDSCLQWVLSVFLESLPWPWNASILLDHPMRVAKGAQRLEKEPGPSCGDAFWLFSRQSSGFCFLYIALFLYTARILTSTRKCSSLLYPLTMQHAGRNLTKLQGWMSGSFPGGSRVEWTCWSRDELPLSYTQLAAGSADPLSGAAPKRIEEESPLSS